MFSYPYNLHFVTDTWKICDKNKYREIKNSYLFTEEVTITIYCRTRWEDFLSTKRCKGIDNYLIIKENW